MRTANDCGVVGGQAIVCEARPLSDRHVGWSFRLLLRLPRVDMVRIPVPGRPSWRPMTSSDSDKTRREGKVLPGRKEDAPQATRRFYNENALQTRMTTRKKQTHTYGASRDAQHHGLVAIARTLKLVARHQHISRRRREDRRRSSSRFRRALADGAGRWFPTEGCTAQSVSCPLPIQGEVQVGMHLWC